MSKIKFILTEQESDSLIELLGEEFFVQEDEKNRKRKNKNKKYILIGIITLVLIISIIAMQSLGYIALDEFFNR